MKHLASLLTLGTLTLTIATAHAQSVTIDTAVTSARISTGYYNQKTLWIDVSGIVTAPSGGTLHHSISIGVMHPTELDTQDPTGRKHNYLALLDPKPHYAESGGTLAFSNARARWNRSPFAQGDSCTVFAKGSGQIPREPNGTLDKWEARGSAITVAN